MTIPINAGDLEKGRARAAEMVTKGYLDPVMRQEVARFEKEILPRAVKLLLIDLSSPTTPWIYVRADMPNDSFVLITIEPAKSLITGKPIKPASPADGPVISSTIYDLGFSQPNHGFIKIQGRVLDKGRGIMPDMADMHDRLIREPLLPDTQQLVYSNQATL